MRKYILVLVLAAVSAISIAETNNTFAEYANGYYVINICDGNICPIEVNFMSKDEILYAKKNGIKADDLNQLLLDYYISEAKKNIDIARQNGADVESNLQLASELIKKAYAIQQILDKK